jgi:outer membrane protein OmpA-like peptidoglycan-associated protein
MRRIILICIAACFACPAFSQQQETLPKTQNRHEFFVGGGGGISMLQNNLSIGNRQTAFNYQAGLGYTYFFDYHWGLSIGGEFSFLPIGAKIDLLTDESLVVDPNFDYYHVVSRDVTEKQKFYYINIPLLARYQFDLPVQTMKFYVAAGPKIGIPVKNSYHTKGTLTTLGYSFPDQNGYTRDPFENMLNHGFYTSLPIDYQGEFKKQVYISGALETGLKFSFDEKLGIYAGVFADFGLNNIVDRSTKDLEGVYVYTGEQPIIHSVLTSAYGEVDGENGGIKDKTPFLKRASAISVGLKLGLTFGIDPISKKEVLKTPETAPQKDPYEGLTEVQLQKALANKTNELIRAQQKEFQDLKDFLAKEKEQPDLSATIYCFDFDKDNIPNDMKAVLDNKAQLMREYPRVNLVLEGHTDQAGSDQYNVELGLRRAEAAKSYMVSKGIGSNRLKVTSKGKSFPVTSGTDEQERCRNRRVEFIIDCSPF